MTDTVQWTSTAKRKLSHWRGGAFNPKSIKSLKNKGAEPVRAKKSAADFIHFLNDSFSRSTKEQAEQSKEILQHGAFYALQVLAHFDQALQNRKHFTCDEHPFNRQVELLRLTRREFITLNDQEYKQLTKEAMTLWGGASLLMKVRLAYLFPDQPAWGNEVAKEVPDLNVILRSSPFVHSIASSFPYSAYAMVFASGADMKHISLCAHKMLPEDTSQGFGKLVSNASYWKLLFDLVAQKGAHALPALLQLYAYPFVSGFPTLVEALSLIVTQEVADALAKRFVKFSYNPSTKAPLEGEKAFLIQHPKLAQPAIEKALALKYVHQAQYDLLLAIQQEVLARRADMEDATNSPSQPQESVVARETLPGVLGAPPWRAGGKGNKEGKKPTAKKKGPKSITHLDDTLSFQPEYSTIEELRAKLPEEPVDLDEDAIIDQTASKPANELAHYYQSEPIRRASAQARFRMLKRRPELGKYLSTYTLMELAPLFDEDPEPLKEWIRRCSKKEDLIYLLNWQVQWAGLALPVSQMLSSKKYRDKALAWIKEHPKDAMVGAVAAYINTGSKKTRTSLEEMMRSIQSHDPATFKEVLQGYPEEVVAALPTFEDASGAYPEAMPKLPKFWAPSSYPEILLKSDPSKKLPLELYDDIGLMLKFSPPDTPYVGLDQLREIADEASLGQFCWGLFESWLQSGADFKEDWVLRAIFWFGGPDVPDKLPKMINAWNMDSKKYILAERIPSAISQGANAYVLEALWTLSRIGVGEVKKMAVEKLKMLAPGDTNNEELEMSVDRHMPTLGIEANHTLSLGKAQSLKLWIDQDLQPRIKEAEALQKLDAASKLRWDRLQALCSRQALFIAERLEFSLSTLRRWRALEWNMLIKDHPLMGLVARNLVWATFLPEHKNECSDAVDKIFRIDEEGQTLDHEDNPVTLDPNDHVGLVHPLDLTDNERVIWGNTFADYEIIQPFAQLNRATYTGNIEELYAPFDQGMEMTSSVTLIPLMRQNHWHEFVKRKSRRQRVLKLKRPLRPSRPHIPEPKPPEVSINFRSYPTPPELLLKRTKKLSDMRWHNADCRDLSEMFLELHRLHELVKK